MKCSYSWRPGMETSGVVGNRVLLRLSKFTATGQLKADHSLTVKATKPQNTVEHTEVNQRRAWTKEEIREVIWCYMHCRQRFKENYKKMYEYGEKINQNAECSWMPRN
jgi:hypothetical protein